jgi:hypothetical protein
MMGVTLGLPPHRASLQRAWNARQEEKNEEWDAPLEYKLDPSQWYEWELTRPEGDILVFAPTAADAARTMAENGFIGVDPAKLIKRDRLLSDVLKEID